MDGRLRPHRHELQRRRHPRLAAPRGARGPTTLLLLQGPRRARPSTPCSRARASSTSTLLHRLRRLAGPARAIPTSTPRRRCVTNTGSLGHGDLQGQGVRARRPAGRPRADASSSSPATASCRRASSGSRSAGRERGLRRDHRDRRPQQDPVRHLGRRRSPTSATSRPRSGRSAGRSRAATATTSAALSRTLGELLERPREPPEAAHRRHASRARARRRSWAATRSERVRHRAVRASTPGRRRARTTSARSSELLARGSRREASAAIAVELRGRRAAAAALRPRRRRSSSTPTATRSSTRGEDRRGPRRARRRPATSTAGLIPFRDALPGALRRVRHRRAGHGLPGRRAGARGQAAGRPLVRLLPHAARRTSRSTTTRPRARRSSTPASLAGIVPGGPGHSHQSIRDIALMGSDARA